MFESENPYLHETKANLHGRKNTQLESELNEVRQRLANGMLGSIALTSPEDSLRQLQEENLLLKQQLSQSMTSLISTAKVCHFIMSP
jgi:hypothetical protein